MLLPMQKKKNPERKKEKCISSFEISRSEICTIVKKQIEIKSSAMKDKSIAMLEKTAGIVKEYPKNKIKEISKIEKIAKNSIIYNRR